MDEVKALAEVRMPELVAVKEGFESTLVDDEALLRMGVGVGNEVVPSEVDACSSTPHATSSPVVFLSSDGNDPGIENVAPPEI
ncbi:hypothetical protein AAC387_Pa11g0886 [Persea americana]